MDRAERIVIITGVTMMAIFLACLIYAARVLHITIPFCNDSVTPFTTGQIIDKGGNHFEVHLVARMWKFEPSEIRLPKGAAVDLYVTSVDVNHGVQINGTNVNLNVVPGAVNSTSVTFKENGIYRLVCHEYCGTGHQGMNAKFVITEDLFKAAVPVAAVPNSL